MRFLSFQYQGYRSFGVLKGDGTIVDLGARLAEAESSGLARWLAATTPEQRQKCETMSSDLSLASVKLLPVIPQPAHVWCLAINYQEHIDEIKAVGIHRERTRHPTVFTRYPDTLIADGDPLLLPRVSDSLDWEGELAVIIGKGGRYISEADAMQFVAGYACFNDASVRDWQFHTKQITAGKNFSGTGALGPFLVSADEVANPHDLSVVTRLNGDVVQSGRTSQMIFDIPAFISYVSSILPLQPGDVLATGTPSGVGFTRNPPQFMKAGDVCTVEIEGVGLLTNPVQREVPQSEVGL